MIRITYHGFHRNLQLAVGRLNTLFLDHHFYTAVAGHEGFAKANATPGGIAQAIRNASLIMKVDFYYALYPFSNILSYSDKENPSVIWLNKWNLNRSVPSLANTLMQQCVHAVNELHQASLFDRSEEAQEYRENTAPCWIASLAQRMIQQDGWSDELMLREDETYMQTLFRRKPQPATPGKEYSGTNIFSPDRLQLI